MVYETRHIEAGIRQRDSEFRSILSSFRFGEVDEILYGGQEFPFRDGSCAIVLADDLERSIAVVRKIISTISLSISGGYSERSRKIVSIANTIYGVVSASAGICC